MSLGQVLAFTLLSVAVIAVPGPSVLFTVGRALTVGRRQALLSVLGNALGAYVQAVAVAVGVGVVVERSVAVFTVIKLVGAAYLVFLGVQAIRHRRKVTEALSAGIPTVIPSRRALRDGFVVGVTNPKVIVFFVVALPQFTNPVAGNVPMQMLVLAAVFPVIALVMDSMWALLASTARTWFSRSPRRLEMVGGTGGLMMIGLGATIAVTGRKD
ncbi:threonine/homoserine/homoserine lactone efflux protein [Actinophytocola oryzae]|uniref:Threonine/homoserine/homoserine lactone efflux protein n=2 Tax=Actinophytocola oryzae TaxID=502181 RepID=A0A4R7VQS2_9PSEU|nr:threonine/homoserine/homoserine lactone efflux protein [Actinophytocola oryzae]